MGTKRLIMNLDEAEHATLMKKARTGGDTLLNFVRKALGLPPVQQGKKRGEKRRVTRAPAAKLAPKGE